MAARLNDREISKIRRELESRNLPMKPSRGPRTGTFYVLSYCEPPLVASPVRRAAETLFNLVLEARP